MIKLFVFDVDGCMSDGNIIYSSDGSELKTFSTKDGLAISALKKLGYKSAIITGRKSFAVQRRAEELGITYLHQEINDKKTLLEKILNENGYEWENVAAIGDDFNDLQMLKNAGKSFSPNNGAEYIKQIVDVVLKNNGGDGAIREMIDSIIDEEGKFEEFLKLWQ